MTNTNKTNRMEDIKVGNGLIVPAFLHELVQENKKENQGQTPAVIYNSLVAKIKDIKDPAEYNTAEFFINYAPDEIKDELHKYLLGSENPRTATEKVNEELKEENPAKLAAIESIKKVMTLVKMQDNSGIVERLENKIVGFISKPDLNNKLNLDKIFVEEFGGFGLPLFKKSTTYSMLKEVIDGINQTMAEALQFTKMLEGLLGNEEPKVEKSCDCINCRISDIISDGIENDKYLNLKNIIKSNLKEDENYEEIMQHPKVMMLKEVVDLHNASINESDNTEEENEGKCDCPFCDVEEKVEAILAERKELLNVDKVFIDTVGVIGLAKAKALDPERYEALKGAEEGYNALMESILLNPNVPSIVKEKIANAIDNSIESYSDEEEEEDEKCDCFLCQVEEEVKRIIDAEEGLLDVDALLKSNAGEGAVLFAKDMNPVRYNELKKIEADYNAYMQNPNIVRMQCDDFLYGIKLLRDEEVFTHMEKDGKFYFIKDGHVMEADLLEEGQFIPSNIKDVELSGDILNAKEFTIVADKTRVDNFEKVISELTSLQLN